MPLILVQNLNLQNQGKSCPSSRSTTSRTGSRCSKIFKQFSRPTILGNRNPGIGTENVFKDVYELRGKNRVWVYYPELNGKIEILGK